MSYYRKTIVPNIEAHYENLSAVEKNIADFFISNEEGYGFFIQTYFFDTVCVRGISVPIREKMWL